MYRQLIALIFAGIALISCSGEQNKNESGQALTSPEVADTAKKMSDAANAPSDRSFTTKGGKRIEITEAHPMGMSMSDITVTGQGFTDSIILIKDENPVSDVLEADLDKDGFNEYYIITTAAGSGSYGNIVGIASVKDNSLVRINVADFNDPGDYMGHDSFRIDADKLIRSYPGYKERDTNASPTGETREISYMLKQTAPGKYSLEPVK